MQAVRGHQLRPMLPEDAGPALVLWHNTEGMGLGESDTEERLLAFLQRNPGLSQVALAGDGSLAGTLLCGHDGRRGFLYHLAVSPKFRKNGLGKALVERCLEGLRAQGICKCSLFVLKDNLAGREFWRHADWSLREDLVVVQRTL